MKLNSEKMNEDKLVVRIKTSMWSGDNGLHFKKDLIFMKRKSNGYNILFEDCCCIGCEEVIPRITNFHECDDGLYEVVVCNEERDWESGNIDDYDYKLIGVKEDAK